MVKCMVEYKIRQDQNSVSQSLGETLNCLIEIPHACGYLLL